MNAEASRVGQTFRVTLGMAPPPDLLLFPGASVTVLATLVDAPSEVQVPPTALFKETDGSGALMRFQSDGDTEQGTIEKTPVKIAINEQGEVHVLEGIAPGSEVVIAGVQALSDGQSVSRFDEF